MHSSPWYQMDMNGQLHAQGKSSQYPLDRRLVPQSWSGHSGKENNPITAPARN
jgi:hypothetical protein